MLGLPTAGAAKTLARHHHRALVFFVVSLTQKKNDFKSTDRLALS